MQPLEVGEIAGDDMDEIVARPRHEMAGEDIAAGGKGRLEGAQRIVVLPLERNLDKDVDAEPHRLGIDPRAIAPDHAGRLQPLDAAGAGRGRQADAVGELDRGQPPVLRQHAVDPEIEPIKLHEITV